MDNTILSMEESEWSAKYPLLRSLRDLRECFWINDQKRPAAQAAGNCPFTIRDIEDASDRLDRFAPYLAAAFPETAVSGGILESPLREIPRMKKALEEQSGVPIDGRLLLKWRQRASDFRLHQGAGRHLRGPQARGGARGRRGAALLDGRLRAPRGAALPGVLFAV